MKSNYHSKVFNQTINDISDIKKNSYSEELSNIQSELEKICTSRLSCSAIFSNNFDIDDMIDPFEEKSYSKESSKMNISIKPKYRYSSNTVRISTISSLQSKDYRNNFTEIECPIYSNKIYSANLCKDCERGEYKRAIDRKSTLLNFSHSGEYRMLSSA